MIALNGQMVVRGIFIGTRVFRGRKFSECGGQCGSIRTLLRRSGYEDQGNAIVCEGAD